MGIRDELDTATSAKGRLAILAHHAAKQAHPGSYSKGQLVKASRQVFGGFAANPAQPVRTQPDIDNARNAMALVDGRYPAGMSDCYAVGLSGSCGLECPVFLRGDCESPPTE